VFYDDFDVFDVIFVRVLGVKRKGLGPALCSIYAGFG